MAVNANELISKLNFVRSSRAFKEKGYINEHPDLPSSRTEEEEAVREMIFSFIKKLFVGCKIRNNANSFSLRLDGSIHRKANKIRKLFDDQQEWRNWFDSNHSRLYRTWRDHRRSFESGGIIQRQIREDKVFLYIPNTPSSIYGYQNSGLGEMVRWLEQQYNHDVQLSQIHDDVVKLMEEEIERREREKRERIERELREYTQRLMSKIFKPVAPLQESEDPVDRLFAQKFAEYATQQGIAPEYAVEATADAVVPRDLKVNIMAPPGSEEEGWVALPPFEGYTVPEGYESQGWGKVTSIDMTGERSRGGQSPIVVQEYIYTEFNLDFWKHLLPENHAELLEATARIRQEAEAEIAPFLEQERLQKEAEAQRQREAEEARRRAQEEERRLVEEQIRRQVEQQEAAERRRVEAEEQEAAVQREIDARAAQRRRDLAAQLRSQLGEEPDTSEEAVAERVQRELEAHRQQQQQAPANPEPERATEEGLYLNSRAIPLERYVAIRSNGRTRRFHTAAQAIEFLGYEGSSRVDIRDYHVPHNVVDVYETDQEDDLPF